MLLRLNRGKVRAERARIARRPGRDFTRHVHILLADTVSRLRGRHLFVLDTVGIIFAAWVAMAIRYAGESLEANIPSALALITPDGRHPDPGRCQDGLLRARLALRKHPGPPAHRVREPGRDRHRCGCLLHPEPGDEQRRRDDGACQGPAALVLAHRAARDTHVRRWCAVRHPRRPGLRLVIRHDAAHHPAPRCCMAPAPSAR